MSVALSDNPQWCMIIISIEIRLQTNFKAIFWRHSKAEIIECDAYASPSSLFNVWKCVQFTYIFCHWVHRVRYLLFLNCMYPEAVPGPPQLHSDLHRTGISRDPVALWHFSWILWRIVFRQKWISIGCLITQIHREFIIISVEQLIRNGEH